MADGYRNQPGNYQVGSRDCSYQTEAVKSQSKCDCKLIREKCKDYNERHVLTQICQERDGTHSTKSSNKMIKLLHRLRKPNRDSARIKIFVSGRGSSACLEKSASSYLSGLTAPLDEFAQYNIPRCCSLLTC